MTEFTLNDLAAIIEDRTTSGDAGSYTAKLIGAGVGKCSQKLGEEAVEAVIAAVEGDKPGLVGEAADLLYHLLVVLRVCEVDLADVMDELQRRTGQTGLEEKASRPAED